MCGKTARGSKKSQKKNPAVAPWFRIFLWIFDDSYKIHNSLLFPSCIRFHSLKLAQSQSNHRGNENTFTVPSVAIDLKAGHARTKNSHETRICTVLDWGWGYGIVTVIGMIQNCVACMALGWRMIVLHSCRCCCCRSKQVIQTRHVCFQCVLMF